MNRQSNIAQSEDRTDVRVLPWQLAIGVLGGASILVFAIYWHAGSTMVELWRTRSTYNHGFLILPISAWLIWEMRSRLDGEAPVFSWLGVGGIFFFSGGWLLARYLDILEGEHFAIAGLIQSVFLGAFGLSIFRRLVFPMTYLWLMVPTGTFLYPLLQSLAAGLSVLILKGLGISVFQDGIFIQVPTGYYEVAEGCSGLNFIFSALALAPLYAYLMYTSWKKRVLAVTIMLAVAVTANAMRIAIIIALAEFTNKQIDIVDDHLLFGWGFFAVILALMGWIGSFFADPTEDEEREECFWTRKDFSTMPKAAAILAVSLAVLPLANKLLF